MPKYPLKPINLIVNADDYGYFPCVSRGIAHAAAAGVVKATGVLTNATGIEDQLEWLHKYPSLDVGVHLNLTAGYPLSMEMADQLECFGGCFTNSFKMASMIASGRVDVFAINAEWRAQIEKARHFGFKIRFLNSHEHIHMLPMLFTLTVALAKEYNIPFVRFTRSEWLSPMGVAVRLRNIILLTMGILDSPHRLIDTPVLIGLSQSGKLTLAGLERIFSRLKSGITYELMCHPGYLNITEINNPRLLAYHAWEQELSLLTSPEFAALCKKHNITLINYSA
jgi:predicted glycoside hydrolase/deacetylase ChbG (UPF0249 family)